MSFLDDLLTFKRPLEQGKELIRVPRTFGSLFTSTPFLYKAHETKAGLYAVLPHRKDGSLYVHPGKGEVNEKKSYRELHYPISRDFYLRGTHERREKDQNMFWGSQIQKSASHNKIRLAVDIDVSYLVTQEGIPASVKIEYGFPLANGGHHKKVKFTVCRSSFGEAVAQGLIITSQKKEMLRGVNCEATLENLAGLILRPLTNQEIFDLFGLKYVKHHVLH